MKKTLITLILIVFFSTPVLAGDWTRADTYRELAWTAILIADYGQTMNAARHPDRFIERNLILGEHPSTAAVSAYFLSVAIIHPVISYYLPPTYRKWWQYITIGVEVGYVTHNFAAGVGIGF